jgi:hypothetical protein
MVYTNKQNNKMQENVMCEHIMNKNAETMNDKQYKKFDQ